MTLRAEWIHRFQHITLLQTCKEGIFLSVAQESLMVRGAERPQDQRRTGPKQGISVAT